MCRGAGREGGGARDIRLGAQATEREIKRLSASGELAKYRMVHFATHGVLAGQLDGTHEPGLILTPPDKATEEDDGYLSASEIATLKLDADWVILSACNTAAGAATSAEALSGLARAFIYAQARALAGLALGGLLGRHGQADHGRRPRDGPRSKGRPSGGAAALDAGAHRQGRTARGAPGLLGAVRGGGRGCGGEAG